MRRWIECPACRGIFQAIRPNVTIHTGTLIEPKLLTAPDGTPLEDEYGHPRDIPCYSCGKMRGSYVGWGTQGIYGKGNESQKDTYGDSGGASRFFFTVRNAIDGSEHVYDNKADKGESAWAGTGQSQSTLAASDTPLRRDTIASTSGTRQPNLLDTSSLTFSNGSGTTDPSPTDSESTTKTSTNSITRSTTSNLLIPSRTSDCTADANCETVSGGSLVASAANANLWTPSTGISVPKDGPSTADADHAISPGSLPIDSDGATRFRYVPKASTAERNLGLPEGMHSSHPTIKPVSLLRWLVRLVTPPGGLVLDPFAGSGSCGIAAVLEGMRYIGIEADTEHGYAEIARRRIGYWEMQERQLPLLPY